eukprot:TRINITY_DN5794_c0_g1_i1.p1 TRINITY_DN5794_c0_g1~~TRINITY_DN5794_c0_g1_i1.p1  ORF type:complete len:536 (+),score=100.54 TRINITY_DN5794_c0_g1_i1:61-1668(+)
MAHSWKGWGETPTAQCACCKQLSNTLHIFCCNCGLTYHRNCYDEHVRGTRHDRCRRAVPVRGIAQKKIFAVTKCNLKKSRGTFEISGSRLSIVTRGLARTKSFSVPATAVTVSEEADGSIALSHTGGGTTRWLFVESGDVQTFLRLVRALQGRTVRFSSPRPSQLGRPSMPAGSQRPDATPSVRTPTEHFELSTPREQVTKLCYIWRSKEWRESTIWIQLDSASFAEGNMRRATRLIDFSRPVGQRACVGKTQKPEVYHDGTQEAYFVDVEMQAVCHALALAYNANAPPKRVAFVPAYCVRRHGSNLAPHERLLAVEPYLPGEYTKHNNNYGYVSEDDRNTPQAFSHFTYEYTRHKLIVVDIQGVQDIYTDPQIHTADGIGYGVGNWGQEGFERFFETHTCNALCRGLGLPAVNDRQPRLSGTVSAKDLRGQFDDSFTVSRFTRPLRPVPGSAYAEDLALYGISAADFDRIAATFARYAPAGNPDALPVADVFSLLADLEFSLSQAHMDALFARVGTSDDAVSFREVLDLWRQRE